MADESKSQSATNQSRDWFARLMTDTLKRYTKNASTDYLVQKYPGLPKDIIAKRYIAQQAWAATLAGMASASVVSAAAVGSAALASSIVAIPGLVITLPIGIAAFAIETNYTIRLQIRTAYDLCNLYGLSVNPDDPEDVQKIFAMGMGIKAGELTGNALQRLAPSIALQQTRGLMRTGIRRKFQDWASKNLSYAIARRYLTEKFLLTAIVPGISIILAASWNFYFTKGLGRMVQVRVRGRVMSIEHIHAIQIPIQARPELLLASALNIMGADSRVSENELVVYKELAARLKKLYPNFVHENPGSQDANNWVEKLASVEDEETRKAVYAISEIMTIVDGRVGRKELERLKEIAILSGTQVDKARLEMRARPFKVEPAGRGCSVVASIIGAILLLSACAGSIWLWFLAAQYLQ